MDVKWRRVIGYSQNGEPHQPNVLIGYLLDGTPYAIWDIYQGTIQKVGQSIDKLIISSVFNVLTKNRAKSQTSVTLLKGCF